MPPIIAIEAFCVALTRSYSSAIALTVRLFPANCHCFLPNRTHLVEHGGEGSNRLLELPQFTRACRCNDRIDDVAAMQVAHGGRADL